MFLSSRREKDENLIAESRSNILQDSKHLSNFAKLLFEGKIVLSKSTPWLFVDVVASAESCVVAIRRIVTASHADPDQRRSIIVSTKLQAGSESAATAAPGTVLHSLLFQQSPLSTSRASRVSFYYYI